MSQSPSPPEFQPQSSKPYWTAGKIAALILVVILGVSASGFAAFNYLKPNPAASICSNGATNYPSCNNNICTNGATNPPACNNNVCSNGATNYSTCTLCPSGQTLTGGQCVNNCGNGAINPPTCTRMTIIAGATPNPSLAGQIVTFSATVSGGIGGPICTWTFGDGVVTDAGCSVTHNYAYSGSFEVNVRATETAATGMDSATGSLTQIVNNPTCSNGATNYPACNSWTTSTTITCAATVLTGHNLNSTSCEIKVFSQAPTLPTGSVGVGATGTDSWSANNVPCTLIVFVGYSYCTITKVSTTGPSGTMTLTANYAGDTGYINHASSTGSVSLTVIDPPTSVTVSGTAGVNGSGVANKIGFVNTVTGIGYSVPVYNAGSGTSGTYTVSLPNLAAYTVTVYFSTSFGNGSTVCGTLSLQSTTSTTTADYKC